MPPRVETPEAGSATEARKGEAFALLASARSVSTTMSPSPSGPAAAPVLPDRRRERRPLERVDSRPPLPAPSRRRLSSKPSHVGVRWGVGGHRITDLRGVMHRGPAAGPPPVLQPRGESGIPAPDLLSLEQEKADLTGSIPASQARARVDG